MAAAANSLAIPSKFIETAMAFPKAIRGELSKIKTPKQAADALAQADVLKSYAKRIGAEVEVQNALAEGRLLLVRKTGELLSSVVRARAGRRPKNSSTTLTNFGQVTKGIGISKETASEWQNVAKVPEKHFERYIADSKAEAKEISTAGLLKTRTATARTDKERRRQTRRDANAEIVESATTIDEALEAKFATIVIDPPWDWGDEGDCDQLGRARPQYATISKEQLLALPVKEKADEDAHIYLWITNRSLPKGFELLEAWGFRYVTCLTWCKPSFGMGNYFRGQTEQVLFGVRGSQPLKRKDVGTWFSAPRGPMGHSSKPIEFYGIVKSCSPGPYLEVFARSQRDGWTSWGGELDAN